MQLSFLNGTIATLTLDSRLQKVLMKPVDCMREMHVLG